MENYTPLVHCHPNAKPVSINILDTIQDAVPTTIREFAVIFINQVQKPTYIVPDLYLKNVWHVLLDQSMPQIA